MHRFIQQARRGCGGFARRLTMLKRFKGVLSMENTAHVDVAQSNMCAWFHTSGVQCKKGKKSKQSEDHAQPEQQQVHGTAEASIQMDFEEEHDEEMDKDHEEGDLVNIEKYTRRMHRAIEIFNTSVQKIRGAMPSSNMLDQVHVNAYGESVPLPQVAQSSLKGATLLVVTPFDPSLCKEIEKSIRDANLGFNPSSDEQTVKVPLPKVTKETREARAKQVGEMAEVTKRRVRKIRQRMMDQIKKQTSHGVSEDDVYSQTKQGQAEVDKVIDQIQKIAKRKQEELLHH